jgi:hypothetical protein
LSLVELESMAYRQVVLLDQTQQNLRILNAKIAEKQNASQVVPAPVEPDVSK